MANKKCKAQKVHTCLVKVIHDPTIEISNLHTRPFDLKLLLGMYFHSYEFEYYIMALNQRWDAYSKQAY